MDFAFHPDALSEFKAEISYYEQIQNGLGRAFADEVLRLVESLLHEIATSEPPPPSSVSRNLPAGLIQLVDSLRRLTATVASRTTIGDTKASYGIQGSMKVS